MDTTTRYDLFISYAHADTVLVQDLHRAMRAILRRPLRRAGFKVFRDETGFAASQDLTGRISAALEQSKWFVLVLTPTSAMSPWVDREIAYWCETLGRSDRLLIVRADSSIDLAWDDASKGFLSADTLPAALVKGTKVEPLYVDLESGASDEAAVRIAAAMLDRAPEDVAGEDLRLYRRRRRLGASAIVGLAVLALVSTTASVLAIRSSAAANRNENRAIDGEQEARAQTKKAVADALATRALVEGSERPDKGLALALASSRLDSSGSGENVLLRLVSSMARTDQFFRLPDSLTAVALSPIDNAYVVGDADGKLRTGRLGQELGEPQAALESPVIGLGFVSANRVAVGLADGHISLWELHENGAVTQLRTIALSPIESWSLSTTTGTIAVLTRSGNQVSVNSIEATGEDLNVLAELTDLSITRPTGGSESMIPAALAFDAAGRKLVVAGSFWRVVLDPRTLAASAPALSIDIEVDSVAVSNATSVLGGTPAGSNMSSGLMRSYRLDGSDLGPLELEQSVDSLAACGDRVLFGTSAGEYGWISEPFASFRSIGDVSEQIRSVACSPDGGFVVIGNNGFVHTRTEQPDGPANGFVVAEGSDDERLYEDRFGLSLSNSLSAVRTNTGMEIPFRESAAALVGLLDGESFSATNCASLAPSDLETSSRNEESLMAAECNNNKVRFASDDRRFEVTDTAGSTSSLGEAGVEPYSFAWSADGRRAFVGGVLEGQMYALTDGAPPQTLLRLVTPALFSGASFVSDGHLLITTVHYPPDYAWDINVTVVGGRPLERLACRLGSGSLDGTEVVTILAGFNTDSLGCDAVAQESTD